MSDDLTLKTWAHQFAGAVSHPFMRDNPDYVMPSDELVQIVAEWLAMHPSTKVEDDD